MSKKLVPIDYTSRDFDSIKEDLVSYAKKYYPNSFKDFNEAGFGSLVLDTVAYIGDILSFYLDYQANESFLSTANEYNNILKHGKALGFKVDSTPSSYGVVTLFVRVPAASSGLGVDSKFVPTLRRGTIFGSTNEVMGTSYRSRIDNPKYQFAGKTGTAQVKKITEEERELDLKTFEIPYEQRDHALYVAFGPYKNPRYALSIIVEHGGNGSTTAAPMATKLFKLIIDRHKIRESLGNKKYLEI